MNDAFLHEQGYTYTGEESIYDLTVIEVKQLMKGTELRNKKQDIMMDEDKDYTDWIKHRNAEVKSRN
jgi:hypothetical protein